MIEIKSKWVDIILTIGYYKYMEQKPLRFLSEMVLAPSLSLQKSPLQYVESFYLL